MLQSNALEMCLINILDPRGNKSNASRIRLTTELLFHVMLTLLKAVAVEQDCHCGVRWGQSQGVHAYYTISCTELGW